MLNLDNTNNILSHFQKGRGHLVPKQIQAVHSKTGKTYTKTVWVNPNDEAKEEQQPVGEVVSPDINGMQITKYSEKAVLITGDTYVNKEDLREVKQEIGSGSWNRKLQGWVFPIKFVDSILGILSSKQRDKGNEEKADAITNQKNESLEPNDNVEVNGETAIITGSSSDSSGIKYDVSIAGVSLTGVSEKAIDSPAETDDKKISEALNNAKPENRAKTAKKIFGIKSVDDIHNYTLEAYMGLHGLTDADIQGAIAMLTPSNKPKTTRTSSSSRSANSKEAGANQALSKRQLALKLIRKHRMAVEAAVSLNILLSSEVLKYYPDLAQKQRDMDAANNTDSTYSSDDNILKFHRENAEMWSVKGQRYFLIEIEGGGWDAVDQTRLDEMSNYKILETYEGGWKVDNPVIETTPEANPEANPEVPTDEVGSGRKPMSEETKKKISDALTGRGGAKVEELKAEIAKIKELQITNTKRVEFLKNESSKLRVEIGGLYVKYGDESQEALEIRKKREDAIARKEKIDNEWRNTRTTSLDERIDFIGTKIDCLNSGGVLFDLKDKVGDTHPDIPDFTSVNTENIMYDQDTILNAERPSFIPKLDEKHFGKKEYMPDVSKIGENRYLISLRTYEEDTSGGLSNRVARPYDINQGYAVMTLDQIALTQEYYIEKRKAQNKKDADETNERQQASWFSQKEETRKRILDRVGHRYLSAKQKKTISKEQWDAMDWSEKELHYQHVKKYGVSRVVSKWNNKKNKDKMPTSFHVMHERFVDPTHKRYYQTGGERVRGLGVIGGSKVEIERTESVSRQNYGHSEVFKDWNTIKKMFEWKINDLKVERESYSETYQQGRETSYGETGSSDEILKTDGIKVKRQNGDIISGDEVKQIQKHWRAVQGTFGKLSTHAGKDGLKISHSGKKLMFARKAAGLYVPSMTAIGVTNKYGDNTFGFVLAHEIAHYLDNSLGKAVGGRYLSGNYESSAGKVATIMKDRMEGGENANHYWGSSHECFARSLEQYHAIESDGGDEAQEYFTKEFYASKSVYENELKPAIETFLNEHKSFFKSFMDDLAILGC